MISGERWHGLLARRGMWPGEERGGVTVLLVSMVLVVLVVSCAPSHRADAWNASVAPGPPSAINAGEILKLVHTNSSEPNKTMVFYPGGPHPPCARYALGNGTLWANCSCPMVRCTT